MTKRLFVFGLGYSAQVLAQTCLAAGWHVSGTVRSGEKAENLRRQGISTHVFNGLGPDKEPNPALLRDFEAASHILQSVGLKQGKDPILPIFSAYLTSHSAIWVGYLSTTVVYGNHDGALVDETTPPVPTTERGKARLAAEQAWARLPIPLHIFRLAGIYGPGRNLLVKLQSGKAQTITKPGQVFSRIHVADITKLIFASLNAPIAAPGKPEIYNGADQESAAPETVAAYAAALLGVPAPRLIAYDQASLSPMARSFYADNKRVSAEKMRRLIGSFTYPTYREGLRDLLIPTARINDSFDRPV